MKIELDQDALVGALKEAVSQKLETMDHSVFDEVWTIGQLQEALNMSRGSIYKMIEEGLPVIRRGKKGANIRFLKSSVIEFLKQSQTSK